MGTEVYGTDVIKCKCPKCGHEWESEEEVCIEVDMSDFAPDYP